MPRLFLGLELDEQVIDDTKFLRGGLASARWQRDDQLHITLAFIGDVSQKIAREIAQEMDRLSFHPFEMALKGVGVFGKPDHPKILYSGIDQPMPLQHLHDKINNALRRIDAPVDDRKYKAHCTMARFSRAISYGGAKRDVRDWLAEHEDFMSRMQTVRHFTLYESHLTSEGSVYQILERYDCDYMNYGYQDEVSENDAFYDDMLLDRQAE